MPRAKEQIRVLEEKVAALDREAQERQRDKPIWERNYCWVLWLIPLVLSLAATIIILV